MIRASLAALVLLCAAGAPACAEEAAQAGEPARAASVRQNDLDLTTDRGAGIMLQRLHHAANAVCDAPEINRPSPATRRAMEACRQDALAEAVQLLDAPAVTRLYESGMTQAAFVR